MDAIIGSLIKKIVESYTPVWIICFAKVTTQYSACGCFTDSTNNSVCHYFLLVVTQKNTRIEHEMQDFANQHFTGGYITILAHGKGTIREALQKQSRFFYTVYTKGILCYTHDGASPVQEISPGITISNETAYRAREQYLYHYELSKSFNEAAVFSLEKGKYTTAVFLMHQAVEQACIALLGVHIGYRSDIHNLGRLINLCRCFSEEPVNLFTQTPEEERLFSLLMKSYSETRYKRGFEVGQKDAYTVGEHVNVFVEMARKLCLKGLEILDKQIQSSL
ncbi:HEPN domain-containing protein [Arachidicoccus sp.]|jgi:HEPN domain-containing protein|uniref:HEPN domain-containing protein n=1 Tax=Arachidicoccus sp. TaxID=1872624 RepID=UPI003D19640E